VTALFSFPHHYIETLRLTFTVIFDWLVIVANVHDKYICWHNFKHFYWGWITFTITFQFLLWIINWSSQ